jgi:hypothetical protein
MHNPLIVVLPALIVREMRSAARQPFTYYLRVLGVTALLIDLVLLLSEHGAVAQRGGEMFAHLHATLMLAIWVLVPLVTADCISRERREQTLPILFLTPLTPHQIVLA